MQTYVAIDIGGTKVAGALVKYGAVGEPPVVLQERSVATQAARGGEAVLDTVVQLATELVEVADVPPDGVGVGTAGAVNPDQGAILFANGLMPGWRGQPVKARLESELGLPVAVLGDVQAHALGEARWGAARGAASCLCVGAGTGLGGAFVLGGQVVLGAHGAAGHIGHTLHPAAAGKPCACGATSHVESVTCGTAIAARYQKRGLLDELDPNLMGGEVARRANEGDLEALAVIEQAGRALGEAIGSWCNILDPELVVLSGSVTAAGPFWRRALDEGFKSQVLSPLADIPILYAALGADAPLVGAAEFAHCKRD